MFGLGLDDIAIVSLKDNERLFGLERVMCLEQVIRRERDTLIRAVTDDEWELIVRVTREQVVKGETEYQTLLRSMFVFEYQDDRETWFGVNPILAEARKFQTFSASAGLSLMLILLSFLTRSPTSSTPT